MNPCIKRHNDQLKFETVTWKANLCLIWFSDFENQAICVYIYIYIYSYNLSTVLLSAVWERGKNCIQLKKELLVNDAK
jgi:hypothetical protein